MRSLNNYVEYQLIHVLLAEDVPNEETKDAIRKTQSGNYAGKLDMKDFDSFLNSIDK